MIRQVLETSTGRYFDFADPSPEDVSVEDIAHALSNTCRFGGHVSRYYSVAEHAVLVVRIIEQRTRLDDAIPYPPSVLRAALHHDSHEAYLGDLPTPLKRLMGERYENLRACADNAIAEALRLNADDFNSDVLRWADALALAVEAKQLKLSGGLGKYWALVEAGEVDTYDAGYRLGTRPEQAKADFLVTHARLGGRLSLAGA